MKPFKRLKKPAADATQDYRDKYREAPLSVKFMVRGISYLWCTRTNDPQLAKKRGADYRQKIVSEEFHLIDQMKSRSSIPPYSDLFTMYHELPLRAAKKAKQRAVGSMKAVLTASGLTESSRIDTLSAKLALTYQKASIAAQENPVTMNTRLRCARSLFSKAAMVGYKAYGLDLRPDLVDDFCSVGAMKEPERLPEIPSPELVQLAHATLRPFPDVFRAFLLAAYAGLRSGEIKAARWDWIDNGIIFIGGREFVAKSKRWRSVALAPEVITELERGDKTGPYIAGTFPALTVVRKLPGMLKNIGFTSENPVHSLRRLYGSKVAATAGLWAAQLALGHQSPQTTSNSYARQLNLAPAVGMVTPAAVPQAAG
jgi:integrase